MKKLIWALLAVGVSISAPAVAKKKCDFLPPAAKPSWVDSAVNIEGFHVGVGLQEYEKKCAKQVEKAQQNALANLATTIKVEVKSELSIRQQEMKTGGKTYLEENVESLVNTTANASLENVTFRDNWLDRDSCVVWVLAVVPRAFVQAQREKKLQQGLLAKAIALDEKAADENAVLADRVIASDTAVDMASQINFSLLPESEGQEYYVRLFQRRQDSLNKRQNLLRDSTAVFAEVDALANKITSEPNRNRKNKMKKQALEKLFRLKADYPFEESEYAVAEKSAFRIAEMEKSENNGCGALLQYQMVMDNSYLEGWRTRADEASYDLHCSPAQLKKLSWRKQFEGQKVELACVQNINGNAALWEKPCQEITAILKQHGAVVIRSQQSASEVMALLVQASNDDIETEQMLLLVAADGQMNTRSNSKNPAGKDFQFEGKMSNYLVNDIGVELGDSFAGVGGWNPISADMAMDVLSLNVVKRWEKKTQEYLYQE